MSWFAVRPVKVGPGAAEDGVLVAEACPVALLRTPAAAEGDAEAEGEAGADAEASVAPETCTGSSFLIRVNSSSASGCWNWSRLES